MPDAWGAFRSRLVAFIATLFLGLVPTSFGLLTTSGSPCTDVCSKISTNTTGSEIVCLDKQFNTTTVGKDFKECVSCQLDSTYYDSTTGEADVSWGLYNLRYAFTSCIFDYPKKIVNISTPCVVTCYSLKTALDFDLTSPSANNFDSFCGTSAFADNVVTSCETCYNETTNQIYMANFLEAVRYDCHYRTPSGSAFAISPSRIFKESLLPTTTSALGTSTSTSGSSVKDLTLLIALPILGFIVLACATTVCCFFFIRSRRRKIRARRQTSHLYARWNDTSMSTPGMRHSWGQFVPQQTPGGNAEQWNVPAEYSQGFNFAEPSEPSEYQAQMAEYYSKGDVVEMMKPVFHSDNVPQMSFPLETDSKDKYPDSVPIPPPLHE